MGSEFDAHTASCLLTNKFTIGSFRAFIISPPHALTAMSTSRPSPASTGTRSETSTVPHGLRERVGRKVDPSLYPADTLMW